MSPWSRCSLTKALYIVINTGIGKAFCNFHNNPIVLLTLIEITSNVSQKLIDHQELGQGGFYMGLWDNAVIKK